MAGMEIDACVGYIMETEFYDPPNPLSREKLLEAIDLYRLDRIRYFCSFVGRRAFLTNPPPDCLFYFMPRDIRMMLVDTLYCDAIRFMLQRGNPVEMFALSPQITMVNLGFEEVD